MYPTKMLKSASSESAYLFASRITRVDHSGILRTHPRKARPCATVPNPY